MQKSRLRWKIYSNNTHLHSWCNSPPSVKNVVQFWYNPSHNGCGILTPLKLIMCETAQSTPGYEKLIKYWLVFIPQRYECFTSTADMGGNNVAHHTTTCVAPMWKANSAGKLVQPKTHGILQPARDSSNDINFSTSPSPGHNCIIDVSNLCFLKPSAPISTHL